MNNRNSASIPSLPPRHTFARPCSDTPPTWEPPRHRHGLATIKTLLLLSLVGCGNVSPGATNHQDTATLQADANASDDGSSSDTTPAGYDAEGDVRTGDVRTGDVRTGDVRTDDIHTGDIHTGDGVDAAQSAVAFSIAQPKTGASVYGTTVVRVELAPSPPVSIATMAFLLDGKLLETAYGPPWFFVWDTQKVVSGAHELQVVLTDATGATRTQMVTVEVDQTTPTFRFTAPTDKAVVSGDTVPVPIVLALSQPKLPVYAAAKAVVVAKRGVKTKKIGTLSAKPWRLDWSTKGLASGVWTLAATLTDLSENTVIIERKVLLDRAPIVSWLSPKQGSRVHGDVTLLANVHDQEGVLSARFEVDGKLIDAVKISGTTTTAKTVWQTKPVTRGQYKVTVVVTDKAGRTATTAVGLNVDQLLSATLRLCPSTTVSGCPTKPSVLPVPVTGKVVIHATPIDDDPGPFWATFSVDGVVLGTDKKAPFFMTWDSTGYSEGSHKISTTVHNVNGDAVTLALTVTVNNCDVDTDGFSATSCGGKDCDDASATVRPGSADKLGDGIDQDCDGKDGKDADKDGWIDKGSGGDDCDDSDPKIHPCSDDIAGDGVDSDCSGSDDLSCEDCNSCTTDLASANQCSHIALGKDVTCTDASVCTAVDVCSGGVCLPGAATVCNDGNACTTDSCDPVKGCVFVQAAIACSDGLPCTKGDACKLGACMAGPPNTCTDGNDCTVDVCETKTGCKHEAILGEHTCFGSGCKVGYCDGMTCKITGDRLWQSKVKVSSEMLDAVVHDNHFLGIASILSGGRKIYIISAAGGAYSPTSNPYLIHATDFRATKQGAEIVASLDTLSSVTNPTVGIWSFRPSNNNNSVAPANALLVPKEAITYPSSFAKTTNGDYLVAGILQQVKLYTTVSALVRITTAGKVVWALKHVGADYSRVQDVIADGNKPVALFNVSGKSSVILRLSATGKTVWQASLAGAGKADTYTYQLAQIDKDYVAVGAVWEVGPNAGIVPVIVRVSSTGKPMWRKKLGFLGRFAGVVVANSNLLVAVGKSVGVNQQAIMLATDALGNTQWQRSVGGADKDLFHSIRMTRDGGFVLAGNYGGVAQSQSPDGVGWVLRTDPFGHSSCVAAGGCETQTIAGCDDANPCTADTCEAGKCVATPHKDGTPCGPAKTCSAGLCKP